MSRNSTIVRSRLTTALLAAMLLPTAAFAQSTTDNTSPTTSTDNKPSTELDHVVVTGSLIPQTKKETFTPVTVISAEDMQARGFTSVADALQRTSFATGSVQGNQTSASFTQGAETNSLFGLNPGYTKYLIDGRPMANYPALYNGSDVFNNISGIPIDLVDRIEILPGGQSSLYGSDAIAGVVNIILKKRIEGPTLNARIGGYTDGGGETGRLSFADSFEAAGGKSNTLFGIQYEKTNPIWAYDRDLTKQINLTPYNNGPRVATRDFLVTGRSSTAYRFLDPNNCANVADAFGGTEQRAQRAGRQDFCGSFFSPGYRTLKNGKDSAQVYAHTTYDLSDTAQLYGDVLYSKETTRYNSGANYLWWGTAADWGHYYDVNRRELMNLQRGFTPEDTGGFDRTMSKDKSDSYALTLGMNGTFGDSGWDYDIFGSRNVYRLTEQSLARLRDPITNYFIDHVLGPQLGFDPSGLYPAFAPNYAAFYTLMSPGDFESFTDYTHTHSRTYDNMVRGQLTNSALFSLPGGDAGIAIAAEAGTQGWTYTPDARLLQDPTTLQSQVWGTTSTSGSGSRSRYAVTSELRLPVFAPLTVSLSGRYDAYKAAGQTIAKPTYSLGLEYRPVESLLFRGKYGTAFKAPTLSDEFQGLSGFYSATPDYLACHRDGYDPSDLNGCDFESVQYFGQQQGNTALKPITAKVWSYGVVWAPTAKFSIGADYHHWNIRNEVAQQSVNALMLDELRCTPVASGGTGEYDPASGTCASAFSQVHRAPDGSLDSLFLTKVNVASEVLDALTVDAHYLQDIGRFGSLRFSGSATHNIRHDQQTYPTDPVYDLLDPFYSQDPKTKANASVAWHKGQWTTTLFADYMSSTPNNILWLNGADATGAAMLPHYTTYNASVNWEASDALQLSLLVNNLTNKYPDMDKTYDGLTGAPYDANEYSAYGRSIYLEARWQFGKK